MAIAAIIIPIIINAVFISFNFYVFFNYLHELLQTPAHHVQVVAVTGHSQLPRLLALALPAFRCLHLDKQCVVVGVGHKEDEVCHSSEHALLFEPRACNAVAPAAVRHGKQPRRQVRVFKPEPSDTGHLNAVFLVRRRFAHGIVPLSTELVKLHCYKYSLYFSISISMSCTSRASSGEGM